MSDNINCDSVDSLESFKNRVESIINYIKNETNLLGGIYQIPIWGDQGIIGSLQPFHVKSNPDRLDLLVEWRNRHREVFDTWITATRDNTKAWYEKQVINTSDRVLFFVVSSKGIPVGHIGLSNFDFKERICSIESVLRGERGQEKQGEMTYAFNALLNWGYFVLGVRRVNLHVFSNLVPAIRFYKKNGFIIYKREPLTPLVDGDTTNWVVCESRNEISNLYRLHFKQLKETYVQRI